MRSFVILASLMMRNDQDHTMPRFSYNDDVTFWRAPLQQYLHESLYYMFTALSRTQLLDCRPPFNRELQCIMYHFHSFRYKWMDTGSSILHASIRKHCKKVRVLRDEGDTSGVHCYLNLVYKDPRIDTMHVILVVSRSSSSSTVRFSMDKLWKYIT